MKANIINRFSGNYIVNVAAPSSHNTNNDVLKLDSQTQANNGAGQFILDYKKPDNVTIKSVSTNTYIGVRDADKNKIGGQVCLDANEGDHNNTWILLPVVGKHYKNHPDLPMR